MQFLLKVFIILAGCLPRALAEMLATVFSRIAVRFSTRRQQQMRINVDQVLGLPEHTSFAKTFYRQVLASQMRCFLDTCREIVRPGSITFEGLEDWRKIVREIEQDGHPIIFAAAHIGTWELTGKIIASSCKRQVHALAKWPKISGAGPVLEWLRAQSGMKVMWSHKKSLIRDMMSALRAGEHLAMVIDQKPEGRVGDMVEFYGRTVAFVSGPAAMSSRCKAPIISVATVRTGAGRYRVLGKLVYDPNLSAGSDAEVVQKPEEISQLVASEVERWIRLYPEQWTWEYKRWVFAK